MRTRISTDLGDPRLIKLLKLEAQETDSSIKDVLVRALETYFTHGLDTKALRKSSGSVFKEWNDPRDSDYDKLT
jgi:hypothetical protein